MGYSPFAPTSHAPVASTRPPPLRNDGLEGAVRLLWASQGTGAPPGYHPLRSRMRSGRTALADEATRGKSAGPTPARPSPAGTATTEVAQGWRFREDSTRKGLATSSALLHRPRMEAREQ